MLQTNTIQSLAKVHEDTAKSIKSIVLPIFERLHSELKAKNKEISKGAGKGGKAVDKARNTSQKHIELLGQHTAAFDSAGGKLSANDDPYVLQRGIFHRLNKQVQEENNNRQDMLAVQSSFGQFEEYIVKTFQSGMLQFDQLMNTQADQTRMLYSDMGKQSQNVQPGFEWNGFLKRNNGIMIDPSAPPRSVETLGFANQDHRATKPLIAGSLERKSKVLKKYEPGFYAVTPAKYLHEFKTNDDFAKDPVPENSLYLPDCVIGALDANRFAVKGKDASKGLAAKMSMSHEFQFQAHSPQDAQKWWEVIRSVAGQTSTEMPENASFEGAGAGAGAVPMSSGHAGGAVPASTTQSAYDGAPTQSGYAGQSGSAAPMQSAGHVGGVGNTASMSSAAGGANTGMPMAGNQATTSAAGQTGQQGANTIYVPHGTNVVHHSGMPGQ